MFRLALSKILTWAVVSQNPPHRLLASRHLVGASVIYVRCALPSLRCSKSLWLAILQYASHVQRCSSGCKCMVYTTVLCGYKLFVLCMRHTVPVLQAHAMLVRAQESIAFENLCLTVVAIDTAALVSEYNTMPHMLKSVMSLIHVTAAGLYALETLVHITAHGVNLYLHDRSQQFDFAVMMISVVDGVLFCMAVMNSSESDTRPQSVRVLRSLRVLHLLKFLR